LSLLTEKYHRNISKKNLETVITYCLHIPKERELNKLSKLYVDILE
jgi:hypothetical protein